MTPVDVLDSVWAEHRAAFGVLARIGAVGCIDAATRAGVDFVCIDLQHGFGGFESLAGEIQACVAGGAAPLVRVPSSDGWSIARPLDLGAAGVIVPQVSNAAEARKAVAACRHPPLGERSYGPVRSVLPGDGSGADGRSPRCFVMVETVEGLDQVEQIAETPGLDGVYVGVTDLALALGLSPRGYAASEEHQSAMRRIREACDRAGIVAGLHSHNGAKAKERAEQGFRLVTVGSDMTLLRGGIARELLTATN